MNRKGGEQYSHVYLPANLSMIDAVPPSITFHTPKPKQKSDKAFIREAAPN
jgi:hypothetical protein